MGEWTGEGWMWEAVKGHRGHRFRTELVVFFSLTNTPLNVTALPLSRIQCVSNHCPTVLGMAATNAKRKRDENEPPEATNQGKPKPNTRSSNRAPPKARPAPTGKGEHFIYPM